jgi:hypothetical protein
MTRICAQWVPHLLIHEHDITIFMDNKSAYIRQIYLCVYEIFGLGHMTILPVVMVTILGKSKFRILLIVGTNHAKYCSNIPCKY